MQETSGDRNFSRSLYCFNLQLVFLTWLIKYLSIYLQQVGDSGRERRLKVAAAGEILWQRESEWVESAWQEVLIYRRDCVSTVCESRGNYPPLGRARGRHLAGGMVRSYSNVRCVVGRSEIWAFNISTRVVIYWPAYMYRSTAPRACRPIVRGRWKRKYGKCKYNANLQSHKKKTFVYFIS